MAHIACSKSAHLLPTKTCVGTGLKSQILDKQSEIDTGTLLLYCRSFNGSKWWLKCVSHTSSPQEMPTPTGTIPCIYIFFFSTVSVAFFHNQHLLKFSWWYPYSVYTICIMGKRAVHLIPSNKQMVLRLRSCHIALYPSNLLDVANSIYLQQMQLYIVSTHRCWLS